MLHITPAALAKSRPFPAIAAAPTLAGLFHGQPTERVEAGSAVVWEGDEARDVFEVAEGVLRIYRLMSDGRRAIMGFMHQGDILGVSLKQRYLYTVEAVTTVKVRRFARCRFDAEITASPELRPQLFARLADEMAAAQDQMLLLARKTAEERVASCLLAMTRRQPRQDGDGVVEVAMTRLDLADYLGLTIETVSRTISKLTRRGVIAPAGRHAIAIRKPDALAALAGEDQDDDTDRVASSTRSAVWPQ
jgi:CRP/FNR family transcriptional regulator